LTIAGKTADRMRALPEVARRLPLHDVEQRIVFKVKKVGCGE